MYRYQYFILLFISFNLTSIYTYSSFNLKYLDVSDGLGSNRITCTNIDKHGYLWIGTHLGLGQFDGETITIYPLLTGQFVNFIQEGFENDLLIGTSKGIFQYNRSKDEFRKFLNDEVSFTSSCLYSKGYILSTKNKILVANNSEIVNQFDISAQIENWTSVCKISSICLFSSGELILGVDNFGIFNLDINNGRLKQIYKGIRGHISKIVTYNDKVYCSTYNGLYVFTKDGSLVKHYTTDNSNLPTRYVMDVFPDTLNNRILIALDSYGLFAIDSGGILFNMGDQDGYVDFKNRSITSLLKDYTGNMYLGTAKEGLIVALKSSFNEIIPNMSRYETRPRVSSIVKGTDGTLWCGTDNLGLISFNKNEGIKSYLPDENRAIISVVSFSKDELLISVYPNGLYLFNTGSKKFYSLDIYPQLGNAFKNQEFTILFKDSKSNIWVSSNKLFHIFPQKTIQMVKMENGNNIRAQAIFEDDNGQIWFTQSNRLYYIKDNIAYLWHTIIPKIKSKIGVCALAAGYNGKLLLAYANHVFVVDSSSDTISEKHYILPNSDREIRSIFKTGNDSTYLFTCSKDILEVQFTPDSILTKVIAPSTLKTKEFYRRSFLVDGEKLLIGYNGGICKLSMKEFSKTVAPIKVMLNKIECSDAKYGIKDSTISVYKLRDSLTISRSKSNYTFYFKRQHASNIGEAEYLYKLDGIDSNWQTTQTNKVTYNEIRNGKYTFRIKVKNSSNIVGPESIISINIKYPWFLSPIFLAALFIFIVGISTIVLLKILTRISRKLKNKLVINWGFSNSEHKTPQYLEIKIDDEEFVRKFAAIIDDNLSDSNFEVVQIARLLNVSRTVLYQKTKELTGHSVKDFVIKVRMDKAKQLLETSDKSIIDVAYDCGYSSASYFSSVFKKYYSISPSDYRFQKTII